MDDVPEGSEVIEESEPVEEPGGIESEFEFGAGSDEEEFEQALPPVWVGVVKAVVFPLALLLALAAFWQWDPNWWRGLIVFSVLLEALFGVIYFMSFYEVGLKAEGFLHGGSYIVWSVNRILLLLIWVSTCRASWMAPVGLLALAMAGMMLVDILTYIFIWPEGYGFSFLKGSIIQTISEKLSDMGDLGMYSWLGAKLTLTMATLIAVLPLALKKRPPR